MTTITYVLSCCLLAVSKVLMRASLKALVDCVMGR